MYTGGCHDGTRHSLVSGSPSNEDGRCTSCVWHKCGGRLSRACCVGAMRGGPKRSKDQEERIHTSSSRILLVPCFLVSSALPLVSSCSRFIPASPASNGGIRSALTISSLAVASSGFQCAWPFFCLARESCLCREMSAVLGSA